MMLKLFCFARAVVALLVVAYLIAFAFGLYTALDSATALAVCPSEQQEAFGL